MESGLIKFTEKVLVACGFSEEMRAYLSEGERVSGHDLIDIVCQAPVSLEEKSRMRKIILSQQTCV